MPEKNLTIKRKIFLLSITEVRGYDSPTNANEGASIECLKIDDGDCFITVVNRATKEAEALRIATTSSGKAQSWWLRTPETWDANMVYAVSYDGGSGALPVSGGIKNESGIYEYGSLEGGVRPAFCLSPDTAICEEVVDVEKRYFVSLE